MFIILYFSKHFFEIITIHTKHNDDSRKVLNTFQGLFEQIF